MIARTMIVTACLAAGAIYLDGASKTESVPLRESLASFPLQVADWHGARAPDFEKKILAVLGVDEYLNRLYFRPNQVPVALYIGYYQSQRQGDTIHSPLNCLPGAGWEPVKRGHITIPIGAHAPIQSGEPGSIEVNRFVIERGTDKLALLVSKSWPRDRQRILGQDLHGRGRDAPEQN